MSTDLIEFQDSEINIYSIYDILKSSWKFIFKVTLAFLILGIVASFYNPTKFRSNVLISELTPEQSFYFKSNEALSNSVGVFYNTWYSSALRKFKENNILLKKAEIVKEKAPHLSPKSIIKIYEIHPIDGENNTNSISAEIKFNGNYEDYEVLREVLIATLSEINNEIKNEIISNMKSHVEMMTRVARSDSLISALGKKYEYDELLAKFQEQKRAMSEKLAVEILFLEEQAKIARNLKIAEPKTEEIYDIRNNQSSLISTLNNIDSDELDFNDNYYNKGYLAIEEEVKAISERLNNDKFFTNYETKVKLGLLKSMLESNQELEIAESKIKEQEEFFNFSPVVMNDDFRVYNYFVDSGVSKENSDLFLIITFVLLGFLSGSLIAVLESNYNKYKNEKLS